MSFTRFHDDPCRMKKQLQESTGTGRYMLNVPGNGDKPCYMEDTFVRLQKWGANLRTNTINLESSLLGLNRPLNRDCDKNDYKTASAESSDITYPSCQPFTDQSRATNPAWMVRDLEQVDWYTLPLNPQENTCLPFQNNVSTRILEKDFFVAEAPCVSNKPVNPLTSKPFGGLAASNTRNCLATNSCNNI